ncbi:MAG: hypothetical protein ABSB49_10250 [Polyangia bacterium]|jgi:oligosaccharide reducing-end xylanase
MRASRRCYDSTGKGCLGPDGGNGGLALIATAGQRTDFITAMWNLAQSTGTPRYYSGIIIMLAQLIFSGQMAVY